MSYNPEDRPPETDDEFEIYSTWAPKQAISDNEKEYLRGEYFPCMRRTIKEKLGLNNQLTVHVNTLELRSSLGLIRGEEFNRLVLNADYSGNTEANVRRYIEKKFGISIRMDGELHQGRNFNGDGENI